MGLFDSLGIVGNELFTGLLKRGRETIIKEVL